MNNNQPTTGETEQTITFTKNEPGTGTSMRWTKKTSRKKNPQRKENRQIKEQKRKREKIIDVCVMELQRGPNEGDSSTESTGTPTTHDSSEEATSAAEAQQLADDL